MKKIRKILALTMAMCMIFSMTTVAFAEESTQLGYMGESMEIVVAAGAENSYYEYRVGGMELVVTGENAYIVYGEEEYPAVDGKASVVLAPSMSPMVPTDFAIGNSGDAEETYTVEFAYPTGHMENPEVLDEIYYSYVDVSLVEGDEDGYYYTYTAPADGSVSFYIDTIMTEGLATDSVDLVVDNFVSYKNLSVSADGVENDYGYNEIVMPVSEGDEIRIQVVVIPDENWNRPAASLTWYGHFNYPEGSIDNPIQILDVTSEETIAAGASPYYQAYFAGMIMTIENSDVSVVYGEETYEAVNGVITVEFPPSQSMGRPMPETFQIVNDGTEDVELEIVATYPEGHMENPKEIEAGSFVAEFSATSNGVFYTWTAAEAGKFTVTMTSETGWTYVVNNMTTSKYGDNHAYLDEDAVASETITVAKGDEITIAIAAINEDGMPEDGDVAFKVEFTADEVEDDTVIDSSTTKDPEVDNNSPDTEDAELEEKVDGSVSDKDAILDVSAPSTEAVNKVETAGKDILKDKKYEILELDLFKKGIKLTELKDKIKVTLSVFDDIKDAKWVAVYRLDSDKLTHLGTVEVKDGKFTFETDHFSTYVFAEADEPKVDTDDTVKPGDTSDNAPIAVMVALAATAAFAAVAISKKRAEEN